MKTKEQQYVDRFRELAQKKASIEAVIAKVHGICDSLKNWQKVAAELSVTNMRPEWTEEHLGEVLLFAKLMPEYHLLLSDVNRLWADLASDERMGLAAPSSLMDAAG